MLITPAGAQFFDSAIDLRRRGRERTCRVFRQAGHPHDLTLLLEWEDLGKAELYMNAEELRTKMRQAGVLGKPEVHYLAEMYSIHRSAAD